MPITSRTKRTASPTTASGAGLGAVASSGCDMHTSACPGLSTRDSLSALDKMRR